MPGKERDQYLKGSLVQLLGKERLGRLFLEGDKVVSIYWSQKVSEWLTWSMVLCVFVWLLVRIELDLWLSLGILVGSLIVLAGFAARTQQFVGALLVIVALWAATGLYVFLDAGFWGAAATNLLPFTFVGIAFSTARALMLAFQIPFLLPAALLVVFLPLLTQDMWQLGDEVGVQLVAVGVVSLGPLLFVLIVRYSKTDILDALNQALHRFKESPASTDELVEQIKEAPRADSPTAPDDGWLRVQVTPAFEEPTAGLYVKEVAEKLRSVLHRRIIYRLLRLTFGSTCLFGFFAYLLAWAAIPQRTSAHWIGHGVATTSIGISDAQVSMPLGAYITVAVLLALVATSAFLAFALTEDRYSDALSNALLAEPADAAIRFGLPYLRLA